MVSTVITIDRHYNNHPIRSKGEEEEKRKEIFIHQIQLYTYVLTIPVMRVTEEVVNNDPRLIDIPNGMGYFSLM